MKEIKLLSKKDIDFILVQLDENMAESIIYAPSSIIEFEIPNNDCKRGYDDRAFLGNKHHIRVSEPDDEKAYGIRNIALNSHDKRGQKRYFPHAYANFVTREDVCFF